MSLRVVGEADAGNVAAHRGQRTLLPHGVDEGGDRLRRRRQRPLSVFVAPPGVDGQIGLHSPLRVATDRLAGSPDEVSDLLGERGTRSVPVASGGSRYIHGPPGYPKTTRRITSDNDNYRAQKPKWARAPEAASDDAVRVCPVPNNAPVRTPGCVLLREG